MTTNDALPTTNEIKPRIDWVSALAAIKLTPVGESGGYLRTAFFRDDRRHITIIYGAYERAEQFDNDHGAAELCRLNIRHMRP